ncbi:hypothetical protein AMTRI_Chr03g45300 [Amborella trichopoda]
MEGGVKGWQWTRTRLVDSTQVWVWVQKLYPVGRVGRQFLDLEHYLGSDLGPVRVATPSGAKREGGVRRRLMRKGEREGRLRGERERGDFLLDERVSLFKYNFSC